VLPPRQYGAIARASFFPIVIGGVVSTIVKQTMVLLCLYALDFPSRRSRTVVK
jgi:hypothetical protein